MSNQNINIAFCCDQNYIQYLVPSIISIIYTKDTDTQISISILETGINDYHKNMILKLQKKDIKIEFINVVQSAKDLVLSKTHHKINFNSSILYKLLIPQILKEKEKVLLLDADTIIQKDLLTLFNKDITNYYIASSKRALPYQLKYFMHKDKKYSVEQYYREVLKLPKIFCNKDAKHYINAGVILFNNKKLLADNKDKELIDTFFKYKDLNIKIVYAEQDIFVKVFLDNIKSLLPNEHLGHSFYDKINKKDYNQFLKKHKEAIIVHYVSSKSYSKLMRSIYAKEYFDNLQKSYLKLSRLKIFLLKLESIRKFIYKPKLWWAIPYILRSIKIES
jgi:lipopolysaccharide biosynthesis glycosyltransferase